MKNILNCITIGDYDGIGIELICKIWKKHKKNTKKFFIIGNYNNINKKIKKYNIKIKTKNIIYPNETIKYFDKYLPILNINSKNNIEGTLDSLKIANKLARQKLVSSIITLPINKEKIISIDKKFIDQTKFFGKNNEENVNMILYSKNIIVCPITSHIELKKVKNYINKKFLIKKIYSIIEALQFNFKIKKMNIAVSGLNPHSGENGKIGKEENQIIKPVIEYFRKNNFKVDGPISGDSIFLKKNIIKYDCIITMYHDQALIPFKLLNFYSGVNFTSGIDIIRTSPCHGTAYDVVGKKIANEKSLYNAIILANKIYKNRKQCQKNHWGKIF